MKLKNRDGLPFDHAFDEDLARGSGAWPLDNVGGIPVLSVLVLPRCLCNPALASLPCCASVNARNSPRGGVKESFLHGRPGCKARVVGEREPLLYSNDAFPTSKNCRLFSTRRVEKNLA